MTERTILRGGCLTVSGLTSIPEARRQPWSPASAQFGGRGIVYTVPMANQPPRRFPPPCRAGKIQRAMSSVTPGQALVYVYARNSEAEAMQAKVLTMDRQRGEIAGVLGKGDRGA